VVLVTTLPSIVDTAIDTPLGEPVAPPVALASALPILMSLDVAVAADEAAALPPARRTVRLSKWFDPRAPAVADPLWVVTVAVLKMAVVLAAASGAPAKLVTRTWTLAPETPAEPTTDPSDATTVISGSKLGMADDEPATVGPAVSTSICRSGLTVLLADAAVLGPGFSTVICRFGLNEVPADAELLPSAFSTSICRLGSVASTAEPVAVPV
jgi:hypothetical protein